MLSDTLKTIFSIAEKIYTQVKLTQANQMQCKTLSERVAFVSSAVKKLEGVKDADHYLPGLYALQDCLNEVLQFIKQFSKDTSWFKQILKAGTSKERFAELNEKLQKDVQLLNLGLGAQAIVNREQDKAAELADSTYIHKHLETIIKLNQEHDLKLHRIETKLDEHRAIHARQLASVRGHLVALLDAKIEKTKPLIDPHEVTQIPFHELIIKDKLADGSFSKVFLGVWRMEEVVIKILQADYKSDLMTQLIREIKIMARLRNKHVVQLYGACIEDDHPCLVMEHMERGSLDKVLSKEKFSVTQQRQVALDIAKGLYYLHSCGIIHRDLKSANVLINIHGEAKLTDFGLSKIRSTSVAAAKESSHSIAWLAPECLKRSTMVTAQADIYSFGVILWEICTSKLPFADCKDESTMIKRVCTGKRDMVPDEIPTVYRKIIQGCWQLDPLERPSLIDIIQELTAYNPEDELSAETLYQQGLEHEKSGQLSEARKAYEKSASKGYYKAHTNLGFFYQKGLGGVSKDPKQAYTCFLKAANVGHPRAMINVATMLASGKGVTKDLEKASFWCEKAATSGDAKAAEKCQSIRSLISSTSRLAS